MVSSPKTSRLGDARRLLGWFIGLAAVGYHVALAVVCGLSKYWLSVALSIALAFLFLLWVGLNTLAMVSAMAIAKSRCNVARRVIELPATAQSHQQRLRGAAPVCENPQTDLFAVDADSPRRAESPSDEDGLLSSIPNSSLTNGNVFESNSFLSSVPEGNVRNGGNPLHPRPTSTATTTNANSTAAAPRATRPEATAVYGDISTTQLDETCVLSPPSSMENQVKKEVASRTATTPPAHSRDAITYPMEQLNCESNSSGSHGNTACPPKSRDTPPPMIAARFAQTTQQTVTAQRMSAASTNLSIRVAHSSGWVYTAFMMPVVSAYLAVLLALLTLVSSFLYEYDTHCLFLALPALGVPWIWVRLTPLSDYFQSVPESARSFHGRTLAVLTHWATLLLVCTVSLGVFVAAFTMEIVRWTPYQVNGEAVPTAIRVVSYIHPVTLLLILAVLSFNQQAMRELRPDDGTAAAGAAGLPVEALDSPPRRPPHRAPSGFRPATFAAERNSRPSAFAGLGTFADLSPGGVGSASVPQAGAAAPTCPPSPPPVASDETCSTLSSIVRSSVTSSVFIPPSSLASPTKLSVSKSLLRGSHSSNGSAGHHNAVQPAAILTSVPQLKTVTMLYLAYRDIYDEEDDAAGATLAVHDQKGGVAASRNRQQTVSANFEAMMEALEDAREQGSADANAYVLTAYEDALCLVWGLIPFSSEPVLLAIEKARQTMEAFKSRPKPPTSFSNAQQELVAAVVSAPHSLVGLIGSGAFRGIHFFNPRQHALGAQMLRRGLAMYRRLPSVQASLGEPEVPFHCILIDGRSWNCTASHVLARPCGINRGQAQLPVAKPPPPKRRMPLSVVAKPANRQFLIMYNFMEVVQAKEEEWHLVVQRQERLGSNFNFLTEAVQLLHQGDPNSARQVLRAAVQNTAAKADADNITLAQMLLEDLDRPDDGGAGSSEM